MSLEKIVEEIIATKGLAEEDIFGGDKKPNPATLQTRLARQRSAKGMLPLLYNQYKAELMKRTTVILIVGEDSVNATKILGEQGSVVASVDEFYQDIFKNVPSSLYDGRANASALFDVMSRHIEDKAAAIDIASYPAIIYSNKYSTKVDSAEKALDLLKSMVNNEVGTEMVGYDILEKAARIAVNQNFNESRLPITVSLTDVSLTEAIMEGLKKTANAFHMISVGDVPKNIKKLSSSNVSDVTEESIKTAVMALKTKGEKNVSKNR